jgi:hypothetical protein
MVMAEFLWRGWNAALPEVDVGDDIFVVKDDSGQLWRIQVKTATASLQQASFAAQFRVSLRQLRTARTPELVYIFAVRGDSGWAPFVVVPQSELRAEHEDWGVGSVSRDFVNFRFVYRTSTLRCGSRDFSRFLDDWSRWPVLTHLAEPHSS